MTNLWAFVLLIGPLILVHELGHLLVAKLVDVKVLRFSIGFGPAIARFTAGETEYVIAPIPLGGYVSMLGQSPHDEVSPADAERTLAAKPLWARYLVLAAGPAANLMLPVLLYFFFFLGHTVHTPAIIGTIVDGSAADEAGLAPGDRIVAIDGADVRSWNDMRQRVADAPGQELLFQIERGGRRLERIVTPRRKLVRNALGVATPTGRLGVVPSSYAPQIGLVDPSSPAYLEGLRTGDVITSINGEPVRTVDDLLRMLAPGGDALLRLTYLRPHGVQGPLGTYLWYDSHHAQLLPRKGSSFETGILPANDFLQAVEEGSPCWRAGLRPGDRILAIDGVPFSKWEYLEEVRAHKRDEAPLELQVQTPGTPPRLVTVQQEIRKWRDLYRSDQQLLWFGATPWAKLQLPEPEPIRGRFTYALGSALSQTAAGLHILWVTLGQMLTLERGVEELGSVVGIFNVAGTAADQGPGEFLLLMALLSINLGFINLLPIPVLDGGHLMFFTIEAIRRRPLGQRAREIASAVGLVIILLLLLVATRNDVMRHLVDD